MGDKAYYKFMLSTVLIVILFLVKVPSFALKVPMALFMMLAGVLFYFYITMPVPVRIRSKNRRR